MGVRALRVLMEGTTTSFRYPHFVVGKQLSYPAPPPATIYGHIASALGFWPAPESLRFSYCFSCDGKGMDLEHLWLAVPKEGRGINKQWGHRENVNISMNPYRRELLLHPKLVLYLQGEDEDMERLWSAFRSPRYPVLLGRSQDLASYRAVDFVELQPSSSGYFQGCLLPAQYRTATTAGVIYHMPRYIDPENRTRVEWDDYVHLEHVVVAGERAGANTIRLGEEELCIDPESQEVRGRRRLVYWLPFR